ncbi:MAG: DUF559 domain-containing protein [Prevotella sp.]|nr:DUF559 domain-containing protein [Prevotella sp.]
MKRIIKHNNVIWNDEIDSLKTLHNSNSPQINKSSFSAKVHKKEGGTSCDTSAEEIIWQKIRKRQVDGLMFKRQYPIGPYYLDFYNTDMKLDIEIDGNVHDSTSQYLHDEKRTRFLKSQGVDVLRFSNESVFNQIDLVIEEIKRYKKEHPERIRYLRKNSPPFIREGKEK